MNSRAGPSNAAFTDQWLYALPVEGGHRRCSLEQELLINGLKPCPLRGGIADALDQWDY
jgi:hypothetical protein